VVVLNAFMRRFFYVAAGVVALAVAVPAAAQIVEVGQTTDTPPASCPERTAGP